VGPRSDGGPEAPSTLLRLVACQTCHTQYDVTHVATSTVTCRCGDEIANQSFDGVEAIVHRCGSCGAQVGADADSCGYCGSEICRDSAKLSLICPECFARNEEHTRYCTACGVSFQPQQVDVSGEELPCPVCSGLMPVRAVAGAAVNECPNCNGLWVPDDRFDELVLRACDAAREKGTAGLVAGARVSGANPMGTRVEYRKCPVCEAFMQRSNFRKRSGVIIDRCHTHGTWLDADELERIAGFILEGGMQADAQHYLMEQKLKAVQRREAAALARAQSGDSISIDVPDRRSRGFGGLFIDVLTELLD
jgi:Zn-finger nucleic acid-binding protein